MKKQSLREALRRRKKRKFTFTYLINPNTMRREAYIPCRTFAKIIGRAYRTVLRWTQVRWIPALEIGDSHFYICVVPRKEAFKQYKLLKKKGLVSR